MNFDASCNLEASNKTPSPKSVFTGGAEIKVSAALSRKTTSGTKT
ncbi:unnamed protein product, partial [marine sediment metagenome]